MNIPLTNIQPSPQPVRSSWDEAKMAELIESIRERGVIAPIKVRPVGDRYEIVYGHRRFEASRRLGLAEIPAIVGEMSETDGLIDQLVENELREDLPYLEKAQAFQRALETTGWSIRELAKRTGIGDARIAECVRWLAAKAAGAAVEVRGTAHPTRTGQGEGVEATMEIARSLGDDIPARRAVAAKVSQEELGQHDARKVADAYKAAEDDAERQAILDTPYRDPDFPRLVRAKANVNRDAARAEAQKREDPHEVRQYIDALRTFRQAVQDAIGAAKAGKFSPEAGRFLTNQHDKLYGEMAELERTWEENA